MHFLVLPIVAALAVVGASRDVRIETPRSPRPPRPVVVLVHGRGQLGQDTAALRREWKRDLDSSLASIGFPRLNDEDVQLAWYADVLDPESDSGCMATADTAALGFGTFAREMLANITTALPEQESRNARDIAGDVLFVVDSWKRCAAAQRVGRVVERAAEQGRPVIIVAYSLGSLVTYEYLRSLERDAKHTAGLRLITIGSPLGVRELREMVFDGDASAVSMPASVASWVNVYDPDDLFSSPIAGSDARAGIQDRVTQAASDADAHNVGRYLRDRSTGTALAQALCAADRPQIGEACQPF